MSAYKKSDDVSGSVNLLPSFSITELRRLSDDADRKRDAYHADRLPGLPTGGEYLEAADVFGRYAFTHHDTIVALLEAADALADKASELSEAAACVCLNGSVPVKRTTLAHHVAEFAEVLDAYKKAKGE